MTKTKKKIRPNKVKRIGRSQAQITRSAAVRAVSARTARDSKTVDDPEEAIKLASALVSVRRISLEYSLSNQHHIRALSKALAFFEGLSVLPEDLRRKVILEINPRVRANHHPFHVFLQSAIRLDQVEDPKEKREIQKGISRDVAALQHLVAVGVKSVSLTAFARQPGENVTAWRMAWAAENRGLSGKSVRSTGRKVSKPKSIAVRPKPVDGENGPPKRIDLPCMLSKQPNQLWISITERSRAGEVTCIHDVEQLGKSVTSPASRKALMKQLRKISKEHPVKRTSAS